MTTFDSTKASLNDLLREIREGKIQLPDFQRGWVWDDDHIRDLLVSIARSFPIGAVMLLESGGEVRFQTRPVEGLEGRVPPDQQPEKLILDGQQRLTTLTQALYLDKPVSTRTAKGKKLKRVPLKLGTSEPNLRARYDFELGELTDLPGLLGYVTGSVIYTGQSVAGLKMDAFVQEDTLQRVYQVPGSGLSIQREADEFRGGAAGTELLDEEGIPGGRYEMGDYFLLNAAIGFNTNAWNAELFVDNLADERADVYVDTQQFTPKVVTNRPRTIGLRVNYRFE